MTKPLRMSLCLNKEGWLKSIKTWLCTSTTVNPLRTDKVFTDKVDRTRLGLKDKQFQDGDVHDLNLCRVSPEVLTLPDLSASAEPGRYD